MRLNSVLTKADRWSLKPAFASLTIVTVLGLFCRLPGSLSFVLIPLTMLGYGVATLIILALGFYCILKKRPRRGASILFIVTLPVLFWRPLNWADNMAHLALTIELGIGELGSSSESGANSFVSYDWSVGLVGANTFLIHDVTDEVTLPIAKHKRPPSSEDDLEKECAGKVQRLTKHYYICDL